LSMIRTLVRSAGVWGKYRLNLSPSTTQTDTKRAGSAGRRGRREAPASPAGAGLLCLYTRTVVEDPPAGAFGLAVQMCCSAGVSFLFRYESRNTTVMIWVLRFESLCVR